MTNVFDHVVAEKAHGEVVVTADDAGEDRDAGHCEEDVLHDLGTVHCFLEQTLQSSNQFFKL